MRKFLKTLLFLGILFPVAAYALPEYSERTGKDCSYCHVDSSGGGALTKDGEAFRDGPDAVNNKDAKTSGGGFVKLAAGFLHLLFAIVWFGTILYVHLILKPAYAAGGLPKSEVILGLSSIVVMGVTGVFLTLYRIHSWGDFFANRYGILLFIKIALYLVMVGSAMVVVTVIGPRLRKKKSIESASYKEGLTLDELANFDGREGRPAYAAVEGKIYDMTGSKLWPSGMHVKRHSAGADLGGSLKLAPHGADKLDKMPVVGKVLETGRRSALPIPVRAFYILAYANLALVIAIITVIALWRWWP
jgi:predicted heme/steroid binding protein/uncharacterized membrane protein